MISALSTMERPCNALEAIFVGANIRFLAALGVPEVDASQEETSISCRFHGVVLGESGGKKEGQNVTCSEDPARSYWTTLSRRAGAALAEALADITGGVLQIRVASEWQEQRSLRDLDGCDAQHADRGVSLEGRAYQILIGGALRFGLADDRRGPYDIVVEDIPEPSSYESSGEPVFRRILEASTFTKVLAVGKESSASATGLLVAMLQDAIGSMYLVLVDLRPMLEKEATVVQAIATVTTAAEVRRGAGRLSLAKAASEDIRRRVARGEAHRQARLATSGKFDQCPPPGTVELSNLGTPLGRGMFPVTGHELLLDQRFDGFEGLRLGGVFVEILSILAHTEGTGGPLRLLASVGDGVDGWAISEVLAGGLRQLAALAETGK
ncbi:hypothetical protein AK812_SmicGene20356 [Symbiodinium microadriaticum]|uniref:Uncharacterized protein n=1 Tax=Symbiodinium microadriaticum TaxID=2951 RepID=A0A1Q9DQ59_SYMMI|nr:hypothetical protein AK812_SmicGene20356 [Symbiodinium microadriaticum]